MQTSVQITDKTRSLLDALSNTKGIPVEQLIEEAVSAYDEQNIPISKREWPELEAVFGLWKNHNEDAFDYLQRIRGE